MAIPSSPPQFVLSLSTRGIQGTSRRQAPNIPIMSRRRSDRPNSDTSSNTPRPFPLWGSASRGLCIHVPTTRFCDFHDHSHPNLQSISEPQPAQFTPPPSDLDLSTMGPVAAALPCKLAQLADHDGAAPLGMQYAVQLRRSGTRVLTLPAPCISHAMRHVDIMREVDALPHSARRARATQLSNSALSLSQLQGMLPAYCWSLRHARSTHFGVV